MAVSITTSLLILRRAFVASHVALTSPVPPLTISPEPSFGAEPLVLLLSMVKVVLVVPLPALFEVMVLVQATAPDVTVSAWPLVQLVRVELLVPPLARGSAPLTSAVRLTALKDGTALVLPCRTVPVVPAEVAAMALVPLP